MLLIFSFCFLRSYGQNSPLQEASYKFIDNINNNDFNGFNKSFSFLVRTIIPKSAKQEMFDALTAEGQLELAGDYIERSPRSSLVGFYPTSDSLDGLQYLMLNFNKKYKLNSLRPREDNIIYQPITEQTDMEDLVRPYTDFKNNSALTIGIYHNGKKHFFEYGELEKNMGKQPDQYSLFQIGSVSKVLTGTLLAQMHTQNKVSIHDSVNKYLPAEISSLENKKREVQLVDLATHSSRLPRDYNLEDVEENNPFSSFHREDLHSLLQEVDIDKKLGKEYAYSNVGVGMLGLILSDVENTDFQTTLEKYVLSPLAMNSTTVSVDENNPNKATSYAWGEKVDDMITNDVMVASGGVYSCTNDMVNFIENVTQPKNSTIQSAMDLATKVHFDKNKTLGLNWFHEQSKLGDWKWLKHEGNTPGSSSMLLISKERNFGIVVLGNSSVHVDELAYKVAELYLSDFENNK